MGGFEAYRKRTRRDEFLEQMNKVVPWSAVCALIEPVYPKNDGAGRPTVGLERMLRVYFLQQWFNLSDPAVEEALYDSQSMRQFVGIDLGEEAAPDETTACKFRHLLEKHGLGKAIFAEVNSHLKNQGIKVSTGTIVDASIIHAPTSTKNKDKQRDPDMHQTKKGNQWYFGMKAHIGVDSKSKLIHSVEASAANVHDSQALAYLLHGKERRVWGDSAYRGQRAVNRTKSKVRAKVEHCFLVIKRIFGFDKTRYRGLAKNRHRLHVTCALANLYVVRQQLLRGIA
jgi:IS5 family transposase